MSLVETAGTTRADFLARTAFLAAAAYGAGAVGPAVQRALAQEGGGDTDQLEFLVFINHIERTLYDLGTREVDLSDRTRRTVTTFAQHERAHLDRLDLMLRRLGGRAPEAPAVEFTARLGGERSFLRVATELEEISIQAGDAIASFISSKDVLAEVAKILQVEARHSAAVRMARGRLPAFSAFEGRLPRDQAEQRLRRFVL